MLILNLKLLGALLRKNSRERKVNLKEKERERNKFLITPFQQLDLVLPEILLDISVN